jgi:hypothetical protein
MASRSLTAGMLTAISERTIRPVIFYEGEFVSTGTETAAYLRLWTGIGELSWDSKTWYGGGGLIGITPIEETTDLVARGFTAALTGMDSGIIAAALSNIRQGRPGTLWLGLLDASNALIADPYRLQRGKVDIAIIEDDGQHASVSIRYESRLISLERARSRYYTTEDQAIRYPADQGFAFVPSLQDKEIEWK